MSDRPVIEFPCENYPIKVIGSSGATFKQDVVEIVGRYDESFSAADVEEVPSSQGNYTSVRLAILATGEAQLKALHDDLMSDPQVKMVL